MVRSLYTCFGTPLKLEDNLSSITHSFPTLDHLYQRLPTLENDLRNLGFGYRAKYISDTVKLLYSLGVSSLYEQRESKSYEQVITYLLQFPGVGRKVADCVALFSLDQLDAFPIDIHIYKLSMKRYLLPTLKSKQQKSSSMNASEYLKIRNYFCEVFKVYPGWAQSILFTSELRQFSLKS